MKSSVQVPLTRLLVIQRDEASTRQVAQLVTRYSYHVVAEDDWLAAESWLEENKADAAILEFIESDDDSLRLARRIAASDTPLLFYTSRESIRGLPADLRSVASLEKPDQLNLILKPLAQMLNERFVRSLRRREVHG